MEINQNELYTVKETATFLKCGLNTVYKFIRDGKLKGLKIGRLKITGSSILNLKESE